jgi:hypothetical protein
MEFRAALERLAIEWPISRSDAKRAYLRKVREHPPERDPEAFREVREAWEIVERACRFEERFPGAGSAAADVVAEPSPDVISEQATFVAEIPVPAPAAELGCEELLEPYKRRIDALDNPSDEQVLAIHLEAHRALPQCEQAALMSVYLLDHLKREKEAEEILLRAWPDASFQRLRRYFLANHSNVVPAQLLAEAEVEAENEAQTALALTVYDAVVGRWAPASRRARKLLDSEVTGDPIPDPDLVLCIVLGLESEGTPKRAANLRKAFKAWIERTGYERDILTGRAAVRWALFNELDGLRKVTEERVFRTFAWGAATGRFNVAAVRLRDHFDNLGNDGVFKARALAERTPTFNNLLGDWIPITVPTSIPKRSLFGSGGMGGVMVAAVIGLHVIIRALGSSSSSRPPSVYDYQSSSKYRPSESKYVDNRSSDPPIAWTAQPTPSHSPPKSRTPFPTEFMVSATQHDLQELSNLGWEVADAIALGECSEARSKLEALGQKMNETGVPNDLNEAYDLLNNAVDTRCSRQTVQALLHPDASAGDVAHAADPGTKETGAQDASTNDEEQP